MWVLETEAADAGFKTELSELMFLLLLGPARVSHEFKHPRFTFYPAVFDIFFMGQLFRGLCGIVLLDGLALEKKFIFPDAIASWCDVIFFLIFPNVKKKKKFFFKIQFSKCQAFAFSI